MPFSNCQQCGRLFHRFDPILPESPADYWPNLAQGDVVHDVCPECLKTGQEHPLNLDSTANAASIGGEATTSTYSTPADLEAAWTEWFSHIQKMDERGIALLRAAFEAGWDAKRS